MTQLCLSVKPSNRCYYQQTDLCRSDSLLFDLMFNFHAWCFCTPSSSYINNIITECLWQETDETRAEGPSGRPKDVHPNYAVIVNFVISNSRAASTEPICIPLSAFFTCSCGWGIRWTQPIGSRNGRGGWKRSRSFQPFRTLLLWPLVA